LLVSTVLPILWLRWQAPIFSAFMLRSHFADPASGEACSAVDYRFVPWERISPAMRRAVVVAEDQRFLVHRGFDWKAVERAVRDRTSGSSRRLRGASTLTQQLAKNLFLWPGRSLVRKGLEAWFTVWLELLLPKRRILELYLNVAQLGPCRFGVEAAARRYFGLPAAELGPERAAALAAVLPNPALLRVEDPGPWVLERRHEIRLLLEAGRDASWLEGL
jgi:monofunctional biosynthetic peptidoglycan transglycosylase